MKRAATDALWEVLSAEQTPRLSAALPAPSSAEQLRESYAQLPLTFEANLGQTDAAVQFVARAPGYTVFLTPTEAVLRLQDPEAEADPVVRMQLVGANATASAQGRDALAGRVNYFAGANPDGWHAGVPTFGQVAYENVYPGIDLVWYGNQRQLEYDFVVSPGANPDVIALNFAGAERLELDARGDLVLHESGVQLRQHRPILYQEMDGTRREVAGAYVLTGPQQVSFQVGAYDATRPLVIDPLLTYSSYLGGSGADAGIDIAYDWITGNIVVTGGTQSLDFPTANPHQPNNHGGRDVFVTALTPDGSALVFSTYFGGTGADEGIGVAVDLAGSVFVTGATASLDFPTTPGAFQPTPGGFGDDGFVVQLTVTGELALASYLGGIYDDYGDEIAVDFFGNTYVVGTTNSPNFPTTPGSFQPTARGADDAFIVQVLPGGGALGYGAYVGTLDPFVNDFGLALGVNPFTGIAYVGGTTNSPNFPTTPGAFQTMPGGFEDGFVTAVAPDGSALLYSTYLGGADEDYIEGLAADWYGNVYVTGTTASFNFPTLNAVQPFFGGGDDDGFVSALTADGSALTYSTYLGGFGQEGGVSVAVDYLGNAYVTGTTGSFNFPTLNPVQPMLAGGVDLFLAKFAAGGALAYSTYLGAASDDEGLAVAVDFAGNALLTGSTLSSNFPTVNPYQAAYRGFGDAFIATIFEPLF